MLPPALHTKRTSDSHCLRSGYNTAGFAARRLLLLVWLSATAIVHAQQTVYVKDYGAIANDTLDDATAIQAAFDFAKAHQVKRIEFEAGKYLLKAKAAPALNACFGIAHYSGLQVIGAMVQGMPHAEAG